MNAFSLNRVKAFLTETEDGDSTFSQGEFAFPIGHLEVLQKTRSSCLVFTVQTVVSVFVDKMERDG